jgi:dihydroxyacetone kinase-like protein
MRMNTAQLHQAFLRWATAMEQAAPELNALDGELGDGDLGVTLSQCAHQVRIALRQAPESVPGILRAASQACADASGSSFGTLLASGLLSAAKWLEGGQAAHRATLPQLLRHVIEKLSARGGASLGDKTLLDALHAIAQAIQGAPPQAALAAVARDAAEQALKDFRGRPCRAGRARMFADKSAHLDDPGMVAVWRMTQSLVVPQEPLPLDTPPPAPAGRAG